MSTLSATQIKQRILSAIRRYAQGSTQQMDELIPSALTSGKLYEARILAVVLYRLRNTEGLRIRLVNSNFVELKSAPGPINPHYPHFDLFRGGIKIAELWTDVEFLSMSYSWVSTQRAPEPGDYHELDLVVVAPGCSGRPPHHAVWLGVECKNTGYKKSLLREILGVRRELSLLSTERNTHFLQWPRQSVPANPPSCLLVYSTDDSVLTYSSPGQVFGIDFHHQSL